MREWHLLKDFHENGPGVEGSCGCYDTLFDRTDEKSVDN